MPTSLMSIFNNSDHVSMSACEKPVRPFSFFEMETFDIPRASRNLSLLPYISTILPRNFAYRGIRITSFQKTL